MNNRSNNKPPRRKSPHIRDYSGPVIDYNGVGIWSIEGIQKRYLQLAATFGITRTPLESRHHTEGGRTWVYPLMQQIIERIEAADQAAIEIGIDFIHEDERFAFGMILKSNTARALRRATLTAEQQERIRQRLVAMLLSGQVPHEWREYRRLLKKVGVGALWPVLDSGVDRENKYVMRHYDYLNHYARP
jgi:hypothetical protein